jgi:hypothetical protein
MTNGSDNSDVFGDGGVVDQGQAAELAASLVDPEIAERCRTLSEELDEFYSQAVELVGRIDPVLEELREHEDETTVARCRAISAGFDTTTSYETVLRAAELLRFWSGYNGLLYRVLRFANLLNAAVGLEEALVDEARVEQELAEERGR